jgi:hypothetical protein
MQLLILWCGACELAILIKSTNPSPAALCPLGFGPSSPFQPQAFAWLCPLSIVPSPCGHAVGFFPFLGFHLNDTSSENPSLTSHLKCHFPPMPLTFWVVSSSWQLYRFKGLWRGAPGFLVPLIWTTDIASV